MIEENKFVKGLNDKHHPVEVDPTEEFFGESVQEAIENETGVRSTSWGPKRKSINFINSKPALTANTSTTGLEKTDG